MVLWALSVDYYRLISNNIIVDKSAYFRRSSERFRQFSIFMAHDTNGGQEATIGGTRTTMQSSETIMNGMRQTRPVENVTRRPGTDVAKL